MTVTITADQIRTLYRTGAEIDRGEDYPPVTSDDIQALLTGDVDTDEDGTPTEQMWEVLADHLNATADELDHPQQANLGHLADEMAARDQLHAQAAQMIAQGDDRVRRAVIACINARVPVPTIAATLGVTRARVYQIRDGRR